MTQRLALEILSEGPITIGKMFATLMQGSEPLPFLGDLLFLHIAEEMAPAAPRVMTIEPGEKPFQRVASITTPGSVSKVAQLIS